MYKIYLKTFQIHLPMIQYQPLQNILQRYQNRTYTNSSASNLFNPLMVQIIAIHVNIIYNTLKLVLFFHYNLLQIVNTNFGTLDQCFVYNFP